MSPSAPVVTLTGTERFRCETCQGPALVEEVERFSTYDPVAGEDEAERPRRGRPPKPWRQARDRRLQELGLAG